MEHLFAIPTENGYLCQHFGHCHQFSLVEVNNHTIKNETLVTPPPHEPGLLPKWLAEKGVTDIIAGGMGKKAVDLFVEQGIHPNVGAELKTPKELVADWLQDALVTSSNSCDH